MAARRAHRGRTIAAVGVRVAAGAGEERRPYSVHLGELALLGGGRPVRPQRPAGFTVDAAYPEGDVAEVFLSWQHAEAGVWYYDIDRELPGGGREAVGRILDEVYYAKSLARAGDEAASTLRLVAVAPDGTRSAPATARVRWA